MSYVCVDCKREYSGEVADVCPRCDGTVLRVVGEPSYQVPTDTCSQVNHHVRN